MGNSWVSRHERDIWNPPGWVYAPTVTMSTGKAAAFLGVAHCTLVRHTDEWGFTTYRNSAFYRYYLISELKAFKRELGELTVADIRRAIKGGKNGLETANQKAGKRKRTRK